MCDTSYPAHSRYKFVEFVIQLFLRYVNVKIKRWVFVDAQSQPIRMHCDRFSVTGPSHYLMKFVVSPSFSCKAANVSSHNQQLSMMGHE